MSEQERLNHLMARFLRLNDEGKVYMNTLTRELAHISGREKSPVTGFLRRGRRRAGKGAASGLADMEGTIQPTRGRHRRP
ncbi:MAG: hypothetical protein LBU25_02185 [Treponema sp.]|jgi:hypothetical protein|nr:hypothetical protein [Treponema sp.]